MRAPTELELAQERQQLRLEELTVAFRKSGDPGHQYHAMVIVLLEQLVESQRA